MSEYPPLHCRAGRHGRVHAADSGSALQRPELDVCLSAGAATGLCSQHWARPPDCDLAVCRAPADTLMQQDTRLTLSKCQPAYHPIIMAPSPSDTSYPHNVDWRQLISSKYNLPPLALTAASGRHAGVWWQLSGAPGCISEVSLPRKCVCCSLQSVLSAALSCHCPLCHCHSDTTCCIPEIVWRLQCGTQTSLQLRQWQRSGGTFLLWGNIKRKASYGRRSDGLCYYLDPRNLYSKLN